MTPDEHAKLNQGRALRMSMPALLPVLKSMRENTINQILANYKEGVPYDTKVAELSVIKELEAKIQRTENETTYLEEKLHGKAK